MTEQEMFEKSFLRPKNFFKLPAAEQWKIDKELSILDWKGLNLSNTDIKIFNEHYN